MRCSLTGKNARIHLERYQTCAARSRILKFLLPLVYRKSAGYMDVVRLAEAIMLGKQVVRITLPV